MPIRERVQRLWRLVVRWWRPTQPSSAPEQTVPSAASTSPTPIRSRTATPRRRQPAREPGPAQGEQLIGGAVTLWMWSLGGQLILATSTAEAERAIVRLLPELDGPERERAERLLQDLRTPEAAAA